MSYPTPDLASILQTLSSYAAVPQSQYYPLAQYPYQEQVPPTQYTHQEQAPPALEDGELPYEPPYEPTELPYQPPLSEAPHEPPYSQAEPPYEPPEATAPPQQLPFVYEAQPQQQPPLQPQHQPHQQPPAPQPPKPALPSPSTIMTWPPALRHVSFTLAQNQQSMQRIKHLIATQHKHERQWWAQREALLKKQQGRAEERRKLDGVLSAVGGHIAPMTHVHDSASEKAELERFDRKVYKACQEMVAATMGELGILGVPFFALRKEFVGQGEGMIEDEELLKLRMKMVGYLEDLCRD